MMLNNKIDTWTFFTGSSTHVLPAWGKPVVLLIESDVVHDPDQDFPFTRKAALETPRVMASPTEWRWKLLDFDPEKEEEYLGQCFTVVAWRYF